MQEREEKIHRERDNVLIQSFSINEAEDFLKLNQTLTHRRGDRQQICALLDILYFQMGQ